MLAEKNWAVFHRSTHSLLVLLTIEGCINTSSTGWGVVIIDYGRKYNNNDKGNNNATSTKMKLVALELIIESNEARFNLLSEGPSVHAIESLKEGWTKFKFNLDKSIDKLKERLDVIEEETSGEETD